MKAVLALVVVLIASPALAQTRVLAWDMPGASSAATAQGWTYVVTNNGAAMQAGAVTCQGTTTITCRRAITLGTGINRLVVFVTGGGITVSSDPLASEDPPKPMNLRIEMTVAVNPDGTAELRAFNVEKQ
jgi:hypothetical protein